jgi:hypothetical protein
MKREEKKGKGEKRKGEKRRRKEKGERRIERMPGLTDAVRSCLRS